MRKKIFAIILALVLVLTLAGFVACDKKGAEDLPKKTIVFLGDSIAEALIGPSPLSERDNYGYYALIGRSNGFKYFNHAVSGHKTSGSMLGDDPSGGFLPLLLREEESATLMITHIKQADVIHISILGNNLLQYDLGLLMLEVAQPDFEDDYSKGETLINLLHDGGKTTRESLPDENGETHTVKFNFPNTYQDICDIVDTLKEMNPTAQILFQKVYNPVFEGSKFLYASLLDELAKIEDDGRFGAKGAPITTIEQIRAVAQALLNCLNGILDECLENNPGAFDIVDGNRAFDDYAKTDVRDGKTYLGADSKGASLMYADWTHPSNIGHAVLAAATQAKLEELGLASDNARVVSAYKQIKIEQISRMYAGVSGFNAQNAIASINAASTFQGVSDAYFEAIKGYLPKYC